jgi:L-galactose dehydrogenase
VTPWGLAERAESTWLDDGPKLPYDSTPQAMDEPIYRLLVAEIAGLIAEEDTWANSIFAPGSVGLSFCVNPPLARWYVRVKMGSSNIQLDFPEWRYSIMQYNLLGKTGLNVSRLSFGASSLGAIFHPVEESQAIASVDAVLDYGINPFDVAPGYGGTLSETVLGNARRSVARDRYFRSTKVGEYTEPGTYGNNHFDDSRTRTRTSLNESAGRLRVDYFDITHIRDIECHNRKYTEWALTEGYETVHELKLEGRIGTVTCGIYPIDLWKRIFAFLKIVAALIHNHYCLKDTRLIDLLPAATQRGIGLVNGSPSCFRAADLSGRAGMASSKREDRNWFHATTEFCRKRRSSISRLALHSQARVRRYLQPCSLHRIQ